MKKSTEKMIQEIYNTVSPKLFNIRNNTASEREIQHVKNQRREIVMMKTDLDTFLKFIDQIGKQKHFWTVEIEGLDWTRERKIWNFESAKAVYNLEKRFADAEERRIDIFYTAPNGTKGLVLYK